MKFNQKTIMALRPSAMVVIGALAFCATTAEASIVRYKFGFTAADMMGYATASGADGSTAADNSLFNGARLVRKELGSGDGRTRSYVASENSNFSNWANTTTDRFLGFNLWGLDGNGAKWGDDFKPTKWVSQSNPAGWADWQYNWPGAWGSPPTGYITDEFVGWDASTYGNSLGFSDTGNAAVEFSFIVDLDTDNMFWGGATNGAPNTLPELTFWFGGWMGMGAGGAAGDDIDWSNSYIYEGNMVLKGTQVPEPTTLALLGLGLAGIGFARKKKTT